MNTTVQSLQALYVKLGGSLTDTYDDIADGAAVGNYVVIPDVIDALSKITENGGGVKRFTTTFTNNQGTYEADNSISDIISAWQAGKICDCVIVMAQDTYGLGIIADVVIAENSVVFNSILATDAGPQVALIQGCIEGATDVWLDPVIRDVVPAYTVDDIGKFLGVVSDGDGGATVGWASPA